jgi:hypothetical protein
MNNNKQTAVEWLVEQIKKDINLRFRGFNIDKALEQAIIMEKQQIINGRITAPITTGDIELDRQEAEHYYTQEYGGNND